MKTIQIVSIMLLSFISIFCSSKGGDVNYDTAVTYAKGSQFKFPDFTIEYTGERDEKTSVGLTFKFYDFSVTNGTAKKTVSWSSGTGDIGPVQFEFEGKQYQIELKYSDKLKTKLGENELVIVKK
jgi:hypothetical protein